ncbi:MAG: adenylate kinase [Sedimentisphaerales bacterium]|nr:adenylate kinase [Sedimentisphaerales bacterium]
MRIVLLGAPGAGKGTQCKYIVDRYHLLHLSSGDILRRHRANGTDLGKKAKEYMDSGALVPDNVIIEMMIDEISNAPDGGYVLDGFPRTARQATDLDKALAERKEKIDAVLNLNVNDDVIIRRITGRRICPKCAAVYHVENLKPRKDGICDKDGSKLIQRPDDTAEVVKTRLKNYNEMTAPLVDYYNRKNTVFNIDANEEAEIVKELVFSKLDPLVERVVL